MKGTSGLINFPLIEATRRLFKSGGISVTGFFKLLFYYFQLIASIPLMFLQWVLFGTKIRKTVISGDPVFILGHYRTGTTYLQKLMGSDRQFGFLTNYDALFANSALLFGKRMQPFFQRIINLLKVSNPFFNNSIVLLSEPTEEDDFLMNKVSAYSAYWGLIFPRKWREWLSGEQQFSGQAYTDGWKKEYLETLKYITFRSKAKRLVLKNPPNTERIKYLHQLFPGAKYVFLYRNPYHLYYSTRNMWKRAFLAYYGVQKISDEGLDEIIFGHFAYMMDRYEADKSLIPAGNLIEISYEELKKDPFATVKKIYSQLQIPGFDMASADLLMQIQKEEDYQNFSYRFSDETLGKIEERWGKYIRRWNYGAEKGG